MLNLPKVWQCQADRLLATAVYPLFKKLIHLYLLSKYLIISSVPFPNAARMHTTFGGIVCKGLRAFHLSSYSKFWIWILLPENH